MTPKRTEPGTPLATQLRAARLAAGLTQTELAEKMGTYQPHGGRLERGESAPDVQTLIRFCKAVGCGFLYDGRRFELTGK